MAPAPLAITSKAVLFVLKKARFKDKEAVGLICSVCKGYGVAEPMTPRLRNRITPLLSLFIVYLALALVMLFGSKEHFNEILAFAATLIGSVTGYYFGGRNRT